MLNGTDHPGPGQKNIMNSDGRFRFLLVLMLATSVAMCPLANTSYGSLSAVSAAVPGQPPIQFTPDIDALIIGTPPPTPAIGTLDQGGIDPQVLENYLLIGDNAYRIGDEFLDASGIPLGPVTEDHLGWYGYATIADHPELRLIWTTDINGARHYLITKVTDNLFSGNPGIEPGDGFEDYVRQMNQAEDAFVVSLGGWGFGMGTAILTQYLACGPTAGVGCVTGTITGIVAIVGGIASMAYNTIFKIFPAERNVVRQFALIDANSP